MLVLDTRGFRKWSSSNDLVVEHGFEYGNERRPSEFVQKYRLVCDLCVRVLFLFCDYILNVDCDIISVRLSGFPAAPGRSDWARICIRIPSSF